MDFKIFSEQYHIHIITKHEKVLSYKCNPMFCFKMAKKRQFVCSQQIFSRKLRQIKNELYGWYRLTSNKLSIPHEQMRNEKTSFQGTNYYCDKSKDINNYRKLSPERSFVN